MNFPIDDLLECSRYGELEDIQAYLIEVQESRGLPAPSKDARVDFLSTSGKFGNTMLHMAAANGHLELVKYLLDVLPLPLVDRVNANNEEGNTPLHWAAMNGHAEITELLIENGANGKIQNSGGHTPLYYAQSAGHEEVVKVLLRMVSYESDAEASDEEDNQTRHAPERLQDEDETSGR